MTASLAILSTYPPTQCGLATYSASLVEALLAAGDRVAVVSVVDAELPDPPREVVHQWVRRAPGGARRAAAALNASDLVIIEHEFGIYGGDCGEDVLELLRETLVPIVTMMHTVLAAPSAKQRSIVAALMFASAHLVVMTEAARLRLVTYYGADPASVSVIPHGAPDPQRYGTDGLLPMRKARPTVLTWGLLGRGKGIEWGIEAMSHLRAEGATPLYRIVGETHPRVAEREGESYREHLHELVRRWGLEADVEFDGRYLATPELFAIAAQADIVLLPYDSREQVTSGVLVEAVTLGKPVISTGFPHAVELLATGAGIIVEREDPAAIAAAIRRIMGEPGLSRRMTAEARRLTPDLLWSAVAARHRVLAAQTLRSPRNVAVSA